VKFQECLQATLQTDARLAELRSGVAVAVHFLELSAISGKNVFASIIRAFNLFQEKESRSMQRQMSELQVFELLLCFCSFPLSLSL
jgi:hypothetical protein